MQRPFLRPLDALAVDDGSRQTGVAASLLTAQHVERMVNAIERPVRVPTPQVEHFDVAQNRGF
jgi:hypothetical protein